MKSPDAADVAASGGLEAVRSRPIVPLAAEALPAALETGRGEAWTENRPGNAPWPLVRVFDVTDPPAIPWIVDGLVPERGRVLLAGEPKRARKTWTLMSLALAVASGEPFLGFPTVKPGPALYLSGEERFASVHQRMTLLANGARLGRDLPVYVAPTGAPVPRLDTSADLDKVRRAVEQIEPVLCVFEPWARLRGAGDENDASAVAPILNWLSRLANDSGAAVVLAHHLRKGGGQGFEQVRGSGDLVSWFDTGILAKPAGEGRVRLDFETRHAPVESFGVEFTVIEGDGLHEGTATLKRLPLADVRGAATAAAESIDARILATVSAKSVTSVAQLRRLVGKAKGDVNEAIRRLEQAGELDRSTTPWKVLASGAPPTAFRPDSQTDSQTGLRPAVRLSLSPTQTRSPRPVPPD